jgi:hypothetical protein
MQGKTTIRAAMPAFRQFLRYGLIANAAVLACLSRIYFNHPGTALSALCLRVAAKPPQATSLIARLNRRFLAIPWMLRLSTAIRP